MHRQMPQSVLAVIAAKGHCLHMTHPSLVAAQINTFFQTKLSSGAI
jgi:sigma-B regulation protein RsbQ